MSLGSYRRDQGIVAQKRRSFRRPYGQRRYRRLFVIAAEGEKTEPRYFALFNDASVIHVHCLRWRGDNSPDQVLRRMEQYLEDEEIRNSDEAWLVVDRDQWTEQQLARLHRWSQGADNYGFALSNPKFEYWLLLHFEDGSGVRTSRECSHRLRRHLPSYDKDVHGRKFTRTSIELAVRRADERDIPPCDDWPREPGQTTVYRLVRSILALRDSGSVPPPEPGKRASRKPGAF